MNALPFLCILPLILSTSVLAQSQSALDTSRAHLLRQHYCSDGAFENFNLTCRVTKNTIATTLPELSAFWADYFRDVETITVCVSINNHGGLNESGAVVIYNDKHGDEYTPLMAFDTIKLYSKIPADGSFSFSWVGTSSRRSIFPSGTWTMRGDLFNPIHGSSVYTEVLANGPKRVGEIDTACTPLDEQN